MTKIKHNFTVKALASKVFDAITNVNSLKSWWTTDTSGTSTKGQELRFNFGSEMSSVMRVIQIVSNKEIQWKCIEGPQEWKGTTISFWISEGKNNQTQTQIQFEHDGWKDMSDFFGISNFNWGFYLRSLKTWCETGKGTPFIAEKQMQYTN